MYTVLRQHTRGDEAILDRLCAGSARLGGSGISDQGPRGNDNSHQNDKKQHNGHKRADHVYLPWMESMGCLDV